MAICLLAESCQSLFLLVSLGISEFGECMPESCLVPERRAGQKGANAPAPNLLDVESALQSMKTQFVNFGIRHINDDNVRREYIKQIEKLSADVMTSVKQ